MKIRIICGLLLIAICFGAIAGCSPTESTGKEKPDALVIMTEDLDGLFNPFYSTTGADSTIVSMTQISMLTTGYENGEVVVACGDDEAVVVKDYDIVHNDSSDTTTYTFVIKNGIKFSDGKPLTINDVLFNLYVYLDPVYTGSSTMYSTDIVGLRDYRTQSVNSGSSNTDDTIAEAARNRAKNRINELINLYRQTGKTNTAGSYSASYDAMVSAINKHSLSSGYKAAVSTDPSSVTVKNLLADYEKTLELFRDELNTDYASAKEAYLEEPYKSTGMFDEVTSFMYAEGYVSIEYEKDANNKDILSKIKKVERIYPENVVKDKESAINFVYNDKIENNLDEILLYWATSKTLETNSTAAAKEVILHEIEVIISDDLGRLEVAHVEEIIPETSPDVQLLPFYI